MEANFFDSRVFLKIAALRQVDADLPILRLDAAAAWMSVIGPKAKCRNVRFSAALGALADIRSTLCE
jgi:3'-phosphoadenosine 5'-phosphosulfate sulfotransferase